MLEEAKRYGCTVCDMITLHILHYRLMRDITCKLVLLDGYVLLINVNKSPYTRPMGNFRSGNELATKFDLKCYHYWLQWQPLMNKVTYSTVLSQSKKQQSVCVYTQLHVTVTHSSGLCLQTA